MSLQRFLSRRSFFSGLLAAPLAVLAGRRPVPVPKVGKCEMEIQVRHVGFFYNQKTGAFFINDGDGWQLMDDVGCK